jgi:hypothetical protein
VLHFGADGQESLTPLLTSSFFSSLKLVSKVVMLSPFNDSRIHMIAVMFNKQVFQRNINHGFSLTPSTSLHPQGGTLLSQGGKAWPVTLPYLPWRIP